MVRKLIEWAVNSRLIVLLLALALAGVGGYSFIHINVEAYPDPAPAIIEIVAQYPGASAEEVERQVTIPLEITLAGMPGLTYTRSKSLAGLSHLRNQFDYGIDFKTARQEVINRLQFTQNLPAGVTPQISPETPTGEIFRYTLSSPKDPLGKAIYSLNDLKALQDWTLEREFRRVPRIDDVASSGGTIKRYEVHPDPDRLKMYGLTLQQLQTALANSNANVGGGSLRQGPAAMNVRGIGLIGGGQDPLVSKEVLGLEISELEAWLPTANHLSDLEKQRIRALFLGENLDPPLRKEEGERAREIRELIGARAAVKAVAFLRAEEARRLREIRQIVITSVNNVPVRLEDVVDGGPARSPGELGQQGVVVGHQPRLGKVSLSRPKKDSQGREVRDGNGQVVWIDEDEKVQGIVLLRKDQDSLPALRDCEAKVKELNYQPGRLLPGVQVETYYDRTDLIQVTTETVRENLLSGMVLVTLILLMFLSNVRCALIVAINIPLALLFAFSVLYLRGKSANLLSIGAVDFGIIVDSSVIMVENIYRHLSSGDFQEVPLKERIVRASYEVERGLFFSTAIMVCAFIPLFTMKGPEGQIFGPMADTYAFALGGALLLSLTLSPMLCRLLFHRLQPSRDNFLVRWIRAVYVRQLEWCLDHCWMTLGVLGLLLAGTLAVVPFLGREFMPELEEGNLWIRGTFPLNASLEEVADKSRIAREIMRRYPEVETIVNQMGRPDDGTDPTGFYDVEFFVPLKPEKDWPAQKEERGWMEWARGKRRRSKAELVQEMNAELDHTIIGVDWNFSQNIRDNVMESLSGVKGDNSVKIIGPDLDELERIADQVKNALDGIRGIVNAGVFRIKGQPNLELPVDRAKCETWGVSVNDVNTVIQTAVGGKAVTQMVEGEKLFDISLVLPSRLRGDLPAILNIPVDVTNNTVTPGNVPSLPPTNLTGGASGVSPTGTTVTPPSSTGSVYNPYPTGLSTVPRRRLGDLVTPLDDKGAPNPQGSFIRPGASTISREQGNRLIAVKFSVSGRDLAGAVAEAREKTKSLFQAPYRAEWSGEFQEMEEAEGRLLLIGALALVLIFILLYLAFHSLLDAVVVFSNVVAVSLGGIWTLLVTGTNFNVSAAVGFISILGVAIMNGLLLVSSFNSLRSQGAALREAIIQGVEKLIRPVTMTALAAIFGLLPAAFSTRIGSQSQRPLAIAVVGGMIMTLVLANLVPFLYSLYGHREPPAEGGRRVH